MLPRMTMGNWLFWSILSWIFLNLLWLKFVESYVPQWVGAIIATAIAVAAPLPDTATPGPPQTSPPVSTTSATTASSSSETQAPTDTHSRNHVDTIRQSATGDTSSSWWSCGNDPALISSLRPGSAIEPRHPDVAPPTAHHCDSKPPSLQTGGADRSRAGADHVDLVHASERSHVASKP